MVLPRHRRGDAAPVASWPSVPVLVIAGLVAALLAWLSTAFTFSLMATNTQARAYAPLWASNSVKAATASALLERGNPSAAALKSAQALALDVVKHEPANVTAVRTLGLVASATAPSDVKAQRIFTYAESLSRRDLPTQLWWIEKNVGQNDINGALVHYDRALRTNVGARDILIPVLAEAAKQPAVAAPLTRMLAKRPLWWTEFAEKFIYASDAPDALAATMGALRLDPKKEGERNFLQQTMVSLVQGGAPAKAKSLFDTAVGGQPRSANYVRDGGFDIAGGVAPFDWFFVDEADLGAVRDRREGVAENWVLLLTAQNGRNGVVAQQLLMLAPGTYRFSANGGDMPKETAATPVVSFICAEKSATSLGVFRFPAGVATASVDGAITVPATGCPAVWMQVSRNAPLDRDNVTPWIDEFDIRRG